MPDCAAQPGMQPLGPGAFGQIFDDAAGKTAGDAERVDDLLGVETERRADAGRRAHHAENRGRMEAGLVHRLRHHGAQPAHDLGADRNAEQRGLAVRPVALAGRQHGRHDHRAGMNRPAFEGVVEILAMRRRAVDEGGARRAERAGVADRGAGTVIVAAGERALDVVLVARGDAKADHVDQQVLAFAPHRRRQFVGAQRGDAPGKILGNRDGGKFCCLGHQVRKRTVPKPGIRLTAITTAKVISNMPRPITEMAPRSPLSLRS